MFGSEDDMKRMSVLITSILMITMTTTGVYCAESDNTSERKQITKDFISLLEDDPELEVLMEESIHLAAINNPDRKTNPVQSLDEYYDFLDWSATCMPWNILDGQDTSNLYGSIDQSLDYFYYLLDQPLPELAGEGLYYPCLEYYEPIASWCERYASDWGEFLSSEESWNDEYYELVCADQSFGMNEGWYSDENVWTSFNEWFSRKLVDENQRPISDADVVAPADSTPQGIWEIDENSQMEMGVQLKSTMFYNVEMLIGEDSDYEDRFANGTLTHTFLDVNDYHRYHFPVSGTILEVRKIKALDAVGGLIAWDDGEGRYVLYDANPGWQSVETRDCLIMDTDYGLVAILPIAMSQVSSCNWEESVQVGAKVKKGDPMGYFLFGGSDIVMVFQSCVDVSLVCPQDGDGYKHILMGEAYAELTHADQETERDNSSLDRIHENGVLRVGTTGDYMPMSYLDPDLGEYVGFDVELAEELAEKLGVEIEYVNTSWPTLMDDTLAGKFDLAICGITITDERKEQALMSDGYLKNGKTVLCRAEDADKYISLEAINKSDVRVMENPGGLNEKFARENLPDAELIIHDVNQEIPGLVADGEADVMITEVMEAGYYVGQDSRLAAPLIYEPFTHGELGALMPKGSEDLLEYVNGFLAKEAESGRLDELADEYIYRYIQAETEMEPAA